MNTTDRRKSKNISQFTLEIDRELLYQFKEKALQNRTTMSEMFRKMLQNELKTERK